MREAAKYKIFHDSEVDKIDEKIKKLQGGGGFFGFFSSGPNEEQKKEIRALNEQKKKLLKKNVNEGMKELLNKESSDEIDTMKDIPDNFCLYRVILNLPNFSLDINKLTNERMLSIESNNFDLRAEIRKKGQFFSLLIDDISVKQYQLKNKNMYDTLIATIDQKDDEKTGIKNR